MQKPFVVVVSRLAAFQSTRTAVDGRRAHGEPDAPREPRTQRRYPPWVHLPPAPLREVVLPVRPGRNMSSIIEIAARNELLRQAGHHPAREFVKNLERGLLQPEAPAPRTLRPPSSQFRAYSANESSAPPPVSPLAGPSSSERKP